MDSMHDDGSLADVFFYLALRGCYCKGMSVLLHESFSAGRACSFFRMAAAYVSVCNKTSVFIYRKVCAFDRSIYSCVCPCLFYGKINVFKKLFGTVVHEGSPCGNRMCGGNFCIQQYELCGYKLAFYSPDKSRCLYYTNINRHDGSHNSLCISEKNWRVCSRSRNKCHAEYSKSAV